MPKRPDPLFSIPQPEAFTEPVLELLGGVARPRPRHLTGDEAIAALARIETQAQAGDPAAEAELARRLLTEAPNARKNRRALSLLKKSAAARSPEGLHLLALVHLRGQGLKKDPETGVQLLTAAALAGNRFAQADLAKALLLGVGTPINPAKALYWLRIAAAGGDTSAALSAGRMYRDGVGTYIPKNPSQAVRWLEVAAKAGVARAQYELAECLRHEGVGERDPAASRRWMREAAFSGIVEAQFRTAVACWSGDGGTVDQREAVRWLCRATEGGSARAAAMLAGLFMTGNGLPLSDEKAWILYRWAEILGDASATGMAAFLSGRLSAEAKEAGLALLARPPRERLDILVPRAER